VTVIGDRRPYLVALIVLDPDAAALFAAQHGIADPAPAILAGHPAVRAEIAAAVDTANGKLSQVGPAVPPANGPRRRFRQRCASAEQLIGTLRDV
jgi:long-subunit acyl-CoA synthetase (AMP-forming)